MPVSPWSECARWALDHHRVEVRRVEYIPLLAEVQLRFATGKVFARISSPTLIDGDLVLAESLDIAKHAELIGQGSTLFPGGVNGEVGPWNDRAQRALSAGRTLYFSRLIDDPEALREEVPGFVPGALRELSVPLVERTVVYLASKYRAHAESTAQAQSALVDELEHLEACLERGPYLLGEFSYADIAMATVLHFVSPLSERHQTLARARREALRDAPLAERFTRLTAWRDDLYDRQRN